MVSAALWASTALGFAASQLVVLLRRRSEPGVPDAAPTDFAFGAVDTCPAACPAPSLAFCVLDPLEEYALLVAALLPEPAPLAVVAGCSAASLGVGVLIGRWCAAPRVTRPHGRRPGPAGRGGRA